jgi:hypothetical protein
MVFQALHKPDPLILSFSDPLSSLILPLIG